MNPLIIFILARVTLILLPNNLFLSVLNFYSSSQDFSCKLIKYMKSKILYWCLWLRNRFWVCTEIFTKWITLSRLNKDGHSLFRNLCCAQNYFNLVFTHWLFFICFWLFIANIAFCVVINLEKKNKNTHFYIDVWGNKIDTE